MEPSRRQVPTTLILDFHDSYTRNLLSLFSQLGQLEPHRQTDLEQPQGRDRLSEAQTYVWDTQGWKERVVVVNVDSVTWDQLVQDVLPHINCVILGPGPGSPHRKHDFSWPTRLIEEYGDSLPILGLCLGHQGLATTFGGQVIKAALPRHGQISQVRHCEDPLFAGIPSTFDVVQYNSLVVSAEALPAELEAIAWVDNQGSEEVMALRHRAKPLWGVQFHPESIASSYGAGILSNFLSLATPHTHSPTPSLPTPVQRLSTSSRFDSPIFSSTNGDTVRWEQRTVPLRAVGVKDARTVFEGLVKGQSSLGEIWLDSARPTGTLQHSHLIVPQATWSHTRPSNHIAVHTAHSSTSSPQNIQLSPPETFISSLATAQDRLHRGTRIIDNTRASVPVGFIGYLGYEMKEVSLPLSGPASPPKEDRTDAEFAFASLVLTLDHDTNEWTATGLVRLDPEDQQLDLDVLLGTSEQDWQSWLQRAQGFFAGPEPSASKSYDRHQLPTMVPDLDQQQYMAAIERARASIIAGDAYELCMTTQFRATLPPTFAADPYPLYLSLRAANPAPYSSYFHLPRSNLSLLSSSPERFMRVDKDGNVEMKPIKGTVKRSDDPVEDLRRKAALEADVKERAENLMIVDLSRNDLLGFCEVESVQVPRLMVVESYQTVHQLVTSVVGQLMPSVNPFDAVGQAFPPGSMTGAPKLRSLQLLDALEGHRPRGVYSGVFGFVAVDGTTDFSVVIRTLIIRGSDLTLGAGGAITHLSDAAKEWEEVLVKKDAVVGSLV